MHKILTSYSLRLRKSKQERSQDFVQEGANLARAQGTPYQKPKTPRIWPTIFGSGPIYFLFSFLL